MIGKIASAVGAWLSDLGGDDVTLKPDLDQVSALASEREMQWKRIGEATFLSDSEKRSMLGLPTSEIVDMPLLAGHFL